MASGRPLISSVGASFGIQALNIVTGVLLARSLGPSGRGELTEVILWPTIIALAGSLGVIEATTYHVARATRSLDRILGTVLALAVLQSIALIAVGAAVVALVSHAASDEARLAAYVYLGFIPLNLLTLYLMAVLNGVERYGEFNRARVAVMMVSAVGLMALWAADRLDVMSATLTYLGANVVTLALAARFVGGLAVGRARIDPPFARQILSFGVKTHVSTLSNALNQRLDQLLISVFLLPAQLGLYVVAVTMTSLTSLIGVSISYVALPAVARSEGAGRRGAVRRYAILTFGISALVTVPLLALTAPIIEIAFGADFRAAAGPARVLLLAMLVYSTGRVLAASLKAAARPMDAGYAELLGLVVTALALAVLLPTLEIAGAAWASLLAYASSTAWMARSVMRTFGMRAHELLVPRPQDFGLFVQTVRKWGRRA